MKAILVWVLIYIFYQGHLPVTASDDSWCRYDDDDDDHNSRRGHPNGDDDDGGIVYCRYGCCGDADSDKDDVCCERRWSTSSLIGVCIGAGVSFAMLICCCGFTAMKKKRARTTPRCPLTERASRSSESSGNSHSANWSKNRGRASLWIAPLRTTAQQNQTSSQQSQSIALTPGVQQNRTRTPHQNSSLFTTDFYNTLPAYYPPPPSYDNSNIETAEAPPSYQDAVSTNNSRDNPGTLFSTESSGAPPMYTAPLNPQYNTARNS